MVIRWKDSQCELFHFESTGTALGLLENSQFASKGLQFEKGDLFIAYTDGITEWDNPCGELWGRERLETLLRACRDCTPAQLVRRIVNEVTAFTKGRSQRDDMTLMVVAVDERTSGLREPQLGNIVPGVFTPVLAKHSKSFSLKDCVSVGVDRMQCNFEPMRKQVEAWQRRELTDVTTKVETSDAFVEGRLEVQTNLAGLRPGRSFSSSPWLLSLKNPA